MELKQALASYLNWGVKLQYNDCITGRKKIATLTGVTSSEIETTYSRKINGCRGDIISFKGNNNVNDLKVKPILYPLSDLTKDIEVNGEKFVPIIKLSNDIADFAQVVSSGYANKNYYVNFRVADGYVKKEIPANFNDMHVFDYLKLIEWKFDVFGLIEKGEAIDVTTLTTNPYL